MGLEEKRNSLVLVHFNVYCFHFKRKSMFAELHSDINSHKSSLLHLTGLPYWKKSIWAKVKDGITNLFLRNNLMDRYNILLIWQPRLNPYLMLLLYLCLIKRYQALWVGFGFCEGERLKSNYVIKISLKVEVTNLQSRECFGKLNIDIDLNPYLIYSIQGILKGEVSLYCWPLVWLVYNQLFDYWQFLFLFAKQTNPNLSNRRSMVQWYFPL